MSATTDSLRSVPLFADHFGEMALLDTRARSASITAGDGVRAPA
jgi:hypothetical protein